MSTQVHDVDDVIEILSGRCETLGDHGRRFDKVRPIGEADDLSLTFFALSPERISLVETTRSRVVILQAELRSMVDEIPDKTFVLVDNARLSFARVMRALFSPERKHGIHASAIIGEGCNISPDVYIGPLATIGERVRIGERSVIEAGVHIYDDSIIGKNVTIHAGAVIGMDGFSHIRNEEGKLEKVPQIGKVIIDDDVEIGSNACIARATMTETVIGRNVKIDNLVHVAHNVVVGADSLIIAEAMIGGNVRIGERSWIAPCACIRDNITIGKDVMVGMGAVVTKSVNDGETVFGVPAKPKGGK